VALKMVLFLVLNHDLAANSAISYCCCDCCSASLRRRACTTGPAPLTHGCSTGSSTAWAACWSPLAFRSRYLL